MDLRQISSLLIKIAGLVVIVFAVTGIPGYINSFLSLGKDSLLNFLVWVIIPLIFPLFIGMLMWVFPGSITNKIIENGEDSSLGPELLDGLERIALTVLGLVLLFYALSDLVFNFVYVYMVNVENHQPLMSFRVSAIDWGHIVGTVVELMFALVILFKAEKVMGLIRRKRG